MIRLRDSQAPRQADSRKEAATLALPMPMRLRCRLRVHAAILLLAST